MAWYSSGTATVSNGSLTVSGSGTLWNTRVKPGEAFVGPDQILYEVANVASDTSLTLTAPYAGATAASAPYRIVPTQAVLKTLATQVTDLITLYQTAGVSSVAGRTGVIALVKADVGLANVDNTTDATKPVSTAQAAAIALKANAASPAFTGTPTGLVKAHVGLGTVDNTADTAKPVSTAQQTALNAKLSLTGGRVATLAVTGNMTCDAVVSGFSGFQARAGSGGATSNVFNINWSNNAAQLWIDSSNVGTLSLTSDERIKQGILPINDVTPAFMGITPITYKFRDIGIWDADGKTYWGFSAQNLFSVLPAAVVGDVTAVNPDGTPVPASVIDRPILAVTVRVLQTLVSEVETLRSRVASLEARPYP